MGIDVMVGDDGSIRTVLRERAGYLDAVRVGGLWRPPTDDELEEFDGMLTYRVSEDFLPAYDEAQSGGDSVEFKDFEKYVAEDGD
jgi:hypothetical protein